MNEEKATFCDGWSGLTMDDTVSYINSILLVTANAPCAIFAFLSNLAVIVLSPRTPPCRDPATSYCVAWPSRIFLQLSLLSQCLSYGDLSFQILQSRVQTSY